MTMDMRLPALGLLAMISGTAVAQTPVPAAGRDGVCTIVMPPGTTDSIETVKRVQAMLGSCKGGDRLDAKGLPFDPSEPDSASTWQYMMCDPARPGDIKRTQSGEGTTSLSCVVHPSLALK